MFYRFVFQRPSGLDGVSGVTALKPVVMVHASAQEHVSLKTSEQFLLQFHAQENLDRQAIVPSGVVRVDNVILHFSRFISLFASGAIFYSTFRLLLGTKRLFS